MKRLLRHLALILSSSIVVALAACAPQTTTHQVNTSPFRTTVKLIHSPIGTVDLSWNATSQMLTVHITATGLAPNSTHLEHIHAGSCTSMGAIVSTLIPLQADAHGVGASETTIRDAIGGIPASGWSVTIHNGPTLSTALEARPIACGGFRRYGAGFLSNTQ